ncbi:glycerophosphoryl diester phosphodiesterase [Nocardioides baekrokdamisoli]|uniref:Glycerophosphoryl diester phosphodiesterase n=2 Tax=Nocardioides baekrokdamisoli TaxID=1804624 RepID=A0A3G9J120_9ACTN|nr:glycerophosphoryl diester phosphodiesterase [Nocardioides baekrokdamisoli]
MASMSPQVVAHRGASHDIAEHTLGAYVEALRIGADAVECDVRLTADGHLVCVHDRSLNRTAGVPALVSEMELKDLESFEFASWKGPFQPDIDDRYTRILTLDTLLETVMNAGRRVEVAIETKHPTRFGGLVEHKLARTLKYHGLDGADSPVRVMSFNYAALHRMRRLTPDLNMVMLMDKAQYWPMLRRVIGEDWWLGPGIKEIRDHPKWARRLVETGRPVHVWTVNEAADVQRCLRLGVAGIITDRPAYVMEQLGRTPMGAAG